MFKPFCWMFKNDRFKEHFRYLFLLFIKFLIPIICLASLLIVDKSLSPICELLVAVLIVTCLILPYLCLQGYFWSLTENIINRETDIVGADIYDGKIKECFKITLPEISLKKFLWRGIASTVAMVILIIPITILLTSTFALNTLNSYPTQVSIAILFFISLFIPALLWNYAARDSIFAVLNIRKAIYIMGNYTGKYFLNTIVCILFYILNSVIITLVTIAIGADTTASATIIKSTIISTISYMLFLYSLYVYAYLLGTITPPSEG